MKPTHAANRIRSAMAPVIKAGVMTANVSWNATNSNAGMRPERLGTEVLQPDEVEVADPAAIAEAAEGQRVPHEDPEHRDDAHREEVLHEHGEDVLGPDHAAVEESEPGRHEQHEC